ncbi:multimerin-2 [Trichomycterus rosablanca]|uniref:multimerin-2 n=1 Tax=Trichomycterus rosablanca TaxID=2290929 RepID=UPI002F35A6F8
MPRFSERGADIRRQSKLLCQVSLSESAIQRTSSQGSTGSRMDLAVPLLIVMLLCSPCLSDLRARETDVESVTEEMAGVLDTAYISLPDRHGHHSTARPTEPWLERSVSQSAVVRGNSFKSARRGNWCAFVHRRVVNTAELDATETSTVKSINLCPSGDSDCQIFKYQLSSQPVYRQRQQVLTALHWKCCPGHKGHNCQEKVNPTEGESLLSQEQTAETYTDVSLVDDSVCPPPPSLKMTNVSKQLDKAMKSLRTSGTDLPEDSNQDDENPVHQSSSDHVPKSSDTAEVLHSSASPPFSDSTGPLTGHQILEAMMIKLQPVLDVFNQTLKHISTKVEELSTDLQELRLEQENMFKSREVPSEKAEKELEDSFVQIEQIWAQLDSQQKQIEETAQLQQKLHQHELTSLKEELDHHFNQSHDEIQVSLQLLSESIEEIKFNHERLEATQQEEHGLSAKFDQSHSPPVTSLWKDINSLDIKVLNHTMELSTLSENTRHLTSVVQSLDHDVKNLSLTLEELSQSSEVQFAEILLEIEAARVTAQKSVIELSSSLSNQERQFKEIELDVDNIYQHLQKHEPITAGEICSCKEIRDSLVQLELEVGNVTELAKENQYALEDAEAKRIQSHWTTEVGDLHQGLLSVRESLAFEQAKRRTLYDQVSQLKTTLLDSQQEIIGLKEQDVAKTGEIRQLSASFTSLLNDAIRHSEVLEVLLGKEVMEFSSWTDNQQKELAIPELLQRIHLMQQKVDRHDSHLAFLKKNSRQKEQINNDDPLAFLDWSFTNDHGNNGEDHQDTLFIPSQKDDDDEDYSVSDFWSLGKEVEELAERLSRLEHQHFNHTAPSGGSFLELQEEVAILRQDLEEHLRTFQNLFSYSEELAGSSESLNLDQLWTIIRKKDRKRKKGQEISSIRKRRHTEPGRDMKTSDF